MKTSVETDFLTIGVREQIFTLYNVRTLISFGKRLRGKKHKEASSLPQLLYFLQCLLPETLGVRDKAHKTLKMVSRVLMVEGKNILDVLIEILLCLLLKERDIFFPF